MIQLEINENDKGQRLDRFLRKYFNKAPLSLIYKMIRKDVKINGKRGNENTVLEEGDLLTIYIPEEKAEALHAEKKTAKVKKQFRVAYEDDDILVVSKPAGLLTHGDGREKKNTLANQVMGYLTEKGEFDSGREKTFRPAPINRLDRNTGGLVIFGKNADTVKRLAGDIRTRTGIEKYYMTIVSGDMREEMALEGLLTKNEEKNRVAVHDAESPDEEGVYAKLVARPIESSGKHTLVEVELLTGRTHQIRAQLADAGFPIVGDTKYGGEKLAGQTTQLLHACRLVLRDAEGNLIEIKDSLPKKFEEIKDKLF